MSAIEAKKHAMQALKSAEAAESANGQPLFCTKDGEHHNVTNILRETLDQLEDRVADEQMHQLHQKCTDFIDSIFTQYPPAVQSFVAARLAEYVEDTYC